MTLDLDSADDLPTGRVQIAGTSRALMGRLGLALSLQATGDEGRGTTTEG